jgi:paraquat-inducible protein B
MSRSANPVTVGIFVFSALLIGIAMVMFFSGGNWWSQRQHYVLVYDRSIKGLNVGAPVTIKGVKIGEVQEITARISGDSMTVLNHVLIAIDPEALEGVDDIDKTELMDDMIKRGLSAQLRLQSLLTALLYVDVDFHADKRGTTVDVKTRFKQIPTIPTDLEQLTQNLESIDINKLGQNLQRIVNGVDQLINDKALQRLSGDVSDTLLAVQDAAKQINRQTEQLGTEIVPLVKNSNRTVAELNRSLPQITAKLDETLAVLQDTAKTLEKTAGNAAFLTSEDSPLIYRLDSAAASVSAAAEQMRRLTETLDDQPESIIFGKDDGEN